ncbi:MAG: hypothetical protein HZB33_00205 [Nitrospirae bacterium]|nr:hypothetical protein [Nitrospirota bacterium]
MRKKIGLIRPIGHIRYIGNEKGIALVMVLVLSMIALAIVSALLYMLTQGTRVSGYHKVFKSADEAGIGGVSAVREMIKNRGTLTWTSVMQNACLTQKLSTTGGSSVPSTWPSCGADQLSEDPTVSPDMTVDLPGPPGTSFKTYIKIIDTIQGNTDPGGLVLSDDLRTEGVVTATADISFTPPPIPYLHRIEVQTQNTANPRERSRYSVLYGY